MKLGFATSIAPSATETRSRWDRAIQEAIRAGWIERDDVFIATKLWNNNHRPERVLPAVRASRARLQVEYIDLYLMHTPYAFLPGDDQEPRHWRNV